MTRIRMSGLATATVAALTLAACGGTDEVAEPGPSPATTAVPAETTATETGTEGTTTETEPAETEPAETEPAETTEDRFDVDVVIRVAGGERIGGEGTVKAKGGDRVRILVEVDAAQELHLHGYDISRNATPAKPARFVFEAELEGVFELESHAGHQVIASVAVEP